MSGSHLTLTASLPPRRLLYHQLHTELKRSSSSQQPHLLIPFPQPETAEAPEKQVSHHVSESWRLPWLF